MRQQISNYNKRVFLSQSTVAVLKRCFFEVHCEDEVSRQQGGGCSLSRLRVSVPQKSGAQWVVRVCVSLGICIRNQNLLLGQALHPDSRFYSTLGTVTYSTTQDQKGLEWFVSRDQSRSNPSDAGERHPKVQSATSRAGHPRQTRVYSDVTLGDNHS